MDTETSSNWFVLTAGFKVYGRCPVCHSPHIAYHNTRTPGLKGMTASSKGLTPACMDCGKSLPSDSHRDKKLKAVKIHKAIGLS